MLPETGAGFRNSCFASLNFGRAVTCADSSKFTALCGWKAHTAATDRVRACCEDPGCERRTSGVDAARASGTSSSHTARLSALLAVTVAAG